MNSRMLNLGITLIISLLFAFIYRKSQGQITMNLFFISFILYFLGNTLLGLAIIYIYNLIRGFPTYWFSKSHFIIIVFLFLCMLIGFKENKAAVKNTDTQLVPKNLEE